MSMTILTVKADTLAPIEIDRQASRYGASADAETYIDELVQRWFGHGVDVDGQVIADPISPASGVQAHLAQRPAGLVAVSTHARSGLQRIRFGASAATIVRASVAPGLVVPVRR
jgi:nucleotide-binding universal stress UspA family protein